LLTYFYANVPSLYSRVSGTDHISTVSNVNTQLSFHFSFWTTQLLCWT